jgi:hypothetical protein
MAVCGAEQKTTTFFEGGGPSSFGAVQRTPDNRENEWIESLRRPHMKALALMLLLAGTAVITACASDHSSPPPIVSSSGRVPTQADIDACNTYAKDQSNTGNSEVLKDAAIGGVGGAAVGAGGGAIADGGSGAGKGAAIGAVVGAAAGTLYGLNEKNRNSAGYETAYRNCMAQRGY